MAQSYLVTYTLNNVIHKMENGSIATPAFQRGFVWNKALVKNLFESVNMGYPMGVIFAVRGRSDRYERAPIEHSHFPDSQEKALNPIDTYWIIDGAQRLAALYKVLKGTPTLELFYDLTDKQFRFEAPVQDNAKILKMSSVFKAREFMEAQAALARQPDGDSLLTELNELHRRFQEYQMHFQIIEDIDDDVTFEIFTRLNMSGLKLAREDVEQARKATKSKTGK